MDSVKNTFLQRPLLYLMMSLLLGVVIGIAVIPFLFRIAPGDTTRSRTILKTIKTENPGSHQSCFLGSSVVMNGINTRIMSTSESTVWNFSSPGQRLMESALILAQTPPDYQTVLIGASPTSLCSDGKDISDNKITAYRLYGYTFPKSYLDLANAVNAENLIAASQTSHLGNILNGRWIAKNGVNMWMRNMLRRDLDLKRSKTDLFYPSPYTFKVSEETLQLLLARYCEPSEQNDLTINKDSRLILEYMAEQLEERSGRLILVIMPEHPVKREAIGAESYRRFQGQLDDLQAELGIEVIKLTDSLSDEHFIDHIHPARTGAELLSSEIASYLRQTNPATGTHQPSVPPF